MDTDMNMDNCLAGQSGTEEDDELNVGIAAWLAPRLLLAMETAPTVNELAALLEDFRAGVRCVARKRYTELRQLVKVGVEE